MVKIERVWTEAERITLRPHIERLERLDRERDEALRDYHTAVSVIEPRTGHEWAFDAGTGVWSSEEPEGSTDG